MTDMRDYIEKLETARPIREPMIKKAIEILNLPESSRGLDAGCGIGQPAHILAGAVGKSGHVTGIDISDGLLEHAEKLAVRAGLTDRLTFTKGNIEKLRYDDNTFDWIWSVDCAGYPATEPPERLISEFARIVKPGGIVAILAWSSEKLLPGYPDLEARLAATRDGTAPFVTGRNPELHFLRAVGWFKKAGLTDIKTATIAGDVHAPLDEEHYLALKSFLQMRWPDVKSELSDNDRELFEKLCRPDSPDFILNRGDYYAFYTYTMFYGYKVR
jgi:demethylmenaquinone methyltransferase/2-methoxy-6-polyprenyl-1,4-benzoquinol methylase